MVCRLFLVAEAERTLQAGLEAKREERLAFPYKYSFDAHGDSFKLPLKPKTPLALVVSVATYGWRIVLGEWGGCCGPPVDCCYFGWLVRVHYPGL